MVTDCSECGAAYDGVASRMVCPDCGVKGYCCDEGGVTAPDSDANKINGVGAGEGTGRERCMIYRPHRPRD